MSCCLRVALFRLDRSASADLSKIKFDSCDFSFSAKQIRVHSSMCYFSLLLMSIVVFCLAHHIFMWSEAVFDAPSKDVESVLRPQEVKMTPLLVPLSAATFGTKRARTLASHYAIYSIRVPLSSSQTASSVFPWHRKWDVRFSRLSPYPLHIHARLIDLFNDGNKEEPWEEMLALQDFDFGEDEEHIVISEPMPHLSTYSSLTHGSEVEIGKVLLWCSLAGVPTRSSGLLSEGRSSYEERPVQLAVRLDRLYFGALPHTSLPLLLIASVVMAGYLWLVLPVQRRILESIIVRRR